MRQLLLAAGTEIAAVTGLLFYFGWVRTRVQAEELGFSAGVLNLSLADQILKSVNVLFPLLMALLVIAILGHTAWTVLGRRPSVARAVRRRRGRLIAATRTATWLCVGAGIAGSLPLVNNRFLLPLGLSAGVLLALTARTLQRRATGRDPWSRTRRWMIALLAFFLVFWDVERIAMVVGEQFAADYRARPDQFSEVVLYSKDDLGIEAVGVVATERGDDQDSYRYRYTGLRLMESTVDRYALINEVWTDGNGRVFIIVQTDAVRLEFHDPR
jgi:hypothetical protein